jgi:hypothetical protein
MFPGSSIRPLFRGFRLETAYGLDAGQKFRVSGLQHVTDESFEHLHPCGAPYDLRVAGQYEADIRIARFFRFL